MTDLLNYNTSWLNPALKLIILATFVVAAFIYYRARRSFAGDIHSVLLLLFYMAVAAAVTALLRYFGTGTQFGFTSEFSLKWFESLGALIQAILFILAVKKLAKGIIPEVRE